MQKGNNEKMREIYLVPCAICGDCVAEGSFEIVGRSKMIDGEVPISKINLCLNCMVKVIDAIDESPQRAFERYGLADFNGEYYDEKSITSHWEVR